MNEYFVPNKSFNLEYIYLLVFWRGVIPVIGVYGKNAKRPGVKTNTITAFDAFGIFLLAFKTLLIFLFSNLLTKYIESHITFYLIIGIVVETMIIVLMIAALPDNNVFVMYRGSIHA